MVRPICSLETSDDLAEEGPLYGLKNPTEALRRCYAPRRQKGRRTRDYVHLPAVRRDSRREKQAIA